MHGIILVVLVGAPRPIGAHHGRCWMLANCRVRLALFKLGPQILVGRPWLFFSTNPKYKCPRDSFLANQIHPIFGPLFFVL